MSSSPPSPFDAITEREKGLNRSLSSAQLSMIAIGGAIGTGLFLGSKFAIGFAGPAVLVSYLIGAFIALLLMGCLAEMTVAHPTSGSFGAWAEFYLSPLWGFLLRCAYWAGNALALGTEITAVAVYMQYWFRSVPGWYWILGFSVMMILVNAMHVKFFGTVEYAFSAIKIGAIVAFLILAAWVLFAASHGRSAAGEPPMGFANYTAVGGFFPKGAGGMWTAVLVALFSYFSIEMIAVAAGEAADPTAAISRAFRATLLRLVLFYLLTLVLILAIVPWNVMTNGATRSPFVTVMLRTHIAGAAGVVNFVILIAALSAMNSQLYITTRMMFSLARAGFAPRSLGVLTRCGVPLGALLFSTVGIAVAAALNVLYHDRAFLLMLAISMFGPMFTWLIIFVTHLRFRQRNKQSRLAFRMWGYPYTTLLGAGLMLSALVTTIFKPDFRPTLVYGVPFLLVMTIVYLVQRDRGGTTALSALEETPLA